MYATAYDSHTVQTSGAAAGWRSGLADSAAAAGAGSVGIRGPGRTGEDHRPDDADVTRVLEHCPEVAGIARQVTHAALEDWHAAAGRADAVLLVVSELVTNAVEHAREPLVLHLHREHTGGRIWVGVSDGGPAGQDDDWTSSCADDEHGRGMTIIDTLTNAYDTRTHPNGTTHWARLHAA